MNPKTLTFIGILTLAFICLALAIVTTLVTYAVALILVWALSKPGALEAMMIISFVFLFAVTIIKVANGKDEE